ncbi:ABC transporter permease [Oceanicella sp. SM1341]|uniref:ABC transporter permease n=1 Tax=Oceanicella sp. SM1341 TaxID=1548889 RepID=UPI001300A2A7|nr:ABC transporter permease [Oceanicella sp. SM1341]
MADTASKPVQRAVALGGVALILAAWWWVARGQPEYVLPGPGAVLAATARFLYDPGLMADAGISLLRVAASVLIGMVLALGLASLVRACPAAEEIVERRVLTFLNAFPSVGWAILGVIWFQISTPTVMFVQVAIVLPFCLINALAGFRQIDPEMDELGHSLTRGRWRRFRLLTLPLVAPFVVTGLRVAYGICWKIALVSELFGASSGIGYQLVRAQTVADATMVFACCVVIVLIYAVTDWLFLRPLVQRFSANQARG